VYSAQTEDNEVVTLIRDHLGELMASERPFEPVDVRFPLHESEPAI
jgi:hypothetical protein